MERSVYFWYYDGTDSKAQHVLNAGASLAWVKAGGDQGVVWVPGADGPAWAAPQWDDTHLAPLLDRGIACYPWFYPWPGTADQGAVVAALTHRAAPVLVLNPETEWRVQSPHSPYNTLAEGNRYAEAWVREVRARLPAGTRVGFSAVPSWADFPYEGFAAACEFAHPQHYWPAALLGGEHQVAAHYRRAPQSPCVPILTACGEYDDAGVVALAQAALAYPIAGFSSWESGNAAWQADAMRRAFALLPERAAPPAGGDSPMIRAIRALLRAA